MEVPEVGETSMREGLEEDHQVAERGRPLVGAKRTRSRITRTWPDYFFFGFRMRKISS
jgi:hypothetical protein